MGGGGGASSAAPPGASSRGRLLSYLVFFGATALILAVAALTRGHIHADTHHDAMARSDLELMREAFVSGSVRVKQTLDRLEAGAEALEDRVVSAIESKIEVIKERLAASHENPILDAPHHIYRRLEDPSRETRQEGRLTGKDEQHELEETGEEEGGADGGGGGPPAAGLPTSIGSPLEADGSDSEEQPAVASEQDVSANIDEDKLDELLDAALKEDAEALEKHLSMQVEEQEGDEADMGGERDGEAEEGEEDDGGEAEGERGVVGEAQGAGEGGEHAATKGSPRRPRGRQGQKPSERGKALHPHPATERAAELKSRASERARAARNASKDEPKAAGEGEGEGRRRRRRGRRHCGGHCILRQLRKQKEKEDPEWVTDDSGNFAEDGRPARDDDSGCRGACGKHGFCRQGRCVCVVMYEGPQCENPKKLDGELHSKFEESFLFNAERLKPFLGQHISYTCNPKLGNTKTHTARFKVSEELMKVLPDVDPMAGRIYERCAVVGNAGVLDSYRYGHAIDQHDAVFRFNVGPTVGYESKVGSKTTFRLVNTNHAGWHEKKEADIQQMQSMIGLLLYVKYRKAHRNAKLFAFDPAFSEYVSSNLKVLPTGGYFAIWMSLQRCTQVAVYGFHFEPGFGIKHHYFNSEKPLKGAAAIHDYDAEYKKIRSLAKQNLLTLAEPCIAGCEKDTGIPCVNCPAGSACQCGTGNPMPVSKSGYCRLQGSFTCFLKCDHAKNCPSQLGTGAEANKAAGGCNSAMMWSYSSGKQHCMPIPGEL